jgi:hypothetical protein
MPATSPPDRFAGGQTPQRLYARDSRKETDRGEASNPSLAVVEVEREQDGHRELAYGVVLDAAPDDDAYLVELVDPSGCSLRGAAAPWADAHRPARVSIGANRVTPDR